MSAKHQKKKRVLSLQATSDRTQYLTTSVTDFVQVSLHVFTKRISQKQALVTGSFTDLATVTALWRVKLPGLKAIQSGFLKKT